MQCQHGLLEPKFSSAKHNKNPECMCLGSKLVSQNWCCKYTLVPSLFRNVGVAAFLFDWLYNFIFTRRWGLMWPLVQTVNLFSLKDGDLNSPFFFYSHRAFCIIVSEQPAETSQPCRGTRTTPMSMLTYRSYSNSSRTSRNRWGQTEDCTVRKGPASGVILLLVCEFTFNTVAWIVLIFNTTGKNWRNTEGITFEIFIRRL